MTGPKRHDYLPRYDHPRGLPTAGCHCGWHELRSSITNAGARIAYMQHLEQTVNDFESARNTQRLIMEEYEMGLDT